MSDTGLSLAMASVGAAALVVALWLLCRRDRNRTGGCRTLGGRTILVGVLVLLALIACMWQWMALARTGIVLWQPRATLFPAADIYYLHAVKIRLRQLQAELERRRAAPSGGLSDDEQGRLELLGKLQASLVGWTEQEVGRWLDDIEQRRSLLALTAFQIHAGSQSREHMQQRAMQERVELERRRRWLAIFRAHCANRVAQPPPRSDHASPTTAVADEPARDASRATAADPSGARGSSASELMQELEQVGADTWSFALSVVHDAADATMAAEHLNQIDASLSQMAARRAFVDEYLVPMWTTPPAPGLNQRDAWLRLPVHLPHARAWAAGFALLTGIQAALLLVTLGWVCALPWRRGACAGDAPVAGVLLWTCAATAVACANLGLLYAV